MMPQYAPVQYAPAPQYAPARKAVAPGEARPDDWQCSNTDCINHTKLVFGRHDSCPSCGAAKDAKKEGDWQCPNPNCQNHRSNVFASKTHCPKCYAPRPCGRHGVQQTGYMPPMQQMQPMHIQMHAPMHTPRAAMVPMFVGKGGGGKGKSGAAGDWKCPDTNCINHTKLVFGRHESCPKCGCQKPEPGQAQARAGDWQCPNEECLNHTKMVFGTKDSCPKCGAANPDGRVRSRSPRR